MKTDLNTLLTALYVFVDDHVIPAEQRRPGRPKRLSDAELVCLAVAQVLLGFPSQHHWLRFCYGRLGQMFPYLPKQPGYHKRLIAAGPLLTVAMAKLPPRYLRPPTRCGCWTPPRCRAAPHGETVKRSDLAGAANYGYCASHSRWYWGLKLYLVTTLTEYRSCGVLADPKLGERDVAAELLDHARRPAACGRPG